MRYSYLPEIGKCFTHLQFCTELDAFTFLMRLLLAIKYGSKGPLWYKCQGSHAEL